MVNKKGDIKCPNCGGKGTFKDGEQEITCPCQALKN